MCGSTRTFSGRMRGSLTCETEKRRDVMMRPGVCAQTKDFGPLPLALLLGGGDFFIALLQIHPALHGRVQRRLRFLLLGH